MTVPVEPTEDELLAYRLVGKMQRRADDIGRDVRVLLALVVIRLDRQSIEAYVSDEPVVAAAAE